MTEVVSVAVVVTAGDEFPTRLRRGSSCPALTDLGGPMVGNTSSSDRRLELKEVDSCLSLLAMLVGGGILISALSNLIFVCSV